MRALELTQILGQPFEFQVAGGEPVLVALLVESALATGLSGACQKTPRGNTTTAPRSTTHPRRRRAEVRRGAAEAVGALQPGDRGHAILRDQQRILLAAGGRSARGGGAFIAISFFANS